MWIEWLFISFACVGLGIITLDEWTNENEFDNFENNHQSIYD